MTDIRISRRTALMGGVLATAALSARSALAQQYPSRPIRWLVGYPPGGGTDVLARLLAGAMSPQLGQQLFIENRPGAATNVATEAAVRAEPDGYTVATAGIETLVYNPILYKKLPFDPARELRPVGLSARLHLLLTVKRNSPATSARDFIERARTAPGKIDYGSPGLGSPHHLVMERLMRETGIKLTHVPYRGMAPVITDMLGGVVEAAIVDYAAGNSVLRAGTLRPLAVCSASRLEALPEVPTLEEAIGPRGFDAFAWQGLVVPARTPDAIVARLTEALASALRQESVRTRMREIGIDPLTGGPAEFQARLETDRAAWMPIIRDLGITLD